MLFSKGEFSEICPEKNLSDLKIVTIDRGKIDPIEVPKKLKLVKLHRFGRIGL